MFEVQFWKLFNYFTKKTSFLELINVRGKYFTFCTPPLSIGLPFYHDPKPQKFCCYFLSL